MLSTPSHMGLQDSLPFCPDYKLITVAFKILGLRSYEFKIKTLYKSSKAEV